MVKTKTAPDAIREKEEDIMQDYTVDCDKRRNATASETENLGVVSAIIWEGRMQTTVEAETPKEARVMALDEINKQLTAGGYLPVKSSQVGMRCDFDLPRVVQLRRAAGLTQQELADKAGIHLSQYQKYESGLCSLESTKLKTVMALARALGVTVEELVGNP